MADRGLPSSIRGVLRRLKVKEVKALPDAELLARYVATRDEAAFTVLVGRHGPAVLSVCRRVLPDHDVDDVFQATFLALANEAAAIRRPASIGAWLYEVAYRAALRAKARSVRSHKVEQAAAGPEGAIPTDDLLVRDVQRVLDEELHRLPERLRKPLVLVHLIGHVQAEAARELGITDRALRKRLRVGRDRLRLSLTRRGVALTAAGIVAVLDQSAAAGPLAPGLLRPTVESILAYAAGHAGAVPAATVSLALAGAGSWLAGRLKLVGLIAIPVLASLAFTASALMPAKSKNSPPLAINQQDLERLAPDLTRPDPAKRAVVLTGQVFGADGRPMAHAAVTALMRRPWQSADRGRHDEILVRGIADADGHYHLSVPADFPSWTPDRRVTLLAHSAGHAPVSAEIRLTGEPAQTNLRLPVACSATGRLIGPDHRPAAGVRLATVRLGKTAREVSQGGEQPSVPPGWPADVVTNADGEFQIDGLPAGETLLVQARDDCFALSTFRVTAGTDAVGPMELSEPLVLTGRITAADTGRPLSGARIAVVVGTDRQAVDYYTAMSASPEIASTAPLTEVTGRTDADGRYRMRLPPGEAYQVYVYPPEGAAYVGWHWALTWAAGEATRERSAALKTGVEVVGQVVEEDGQPISGAGVMWMHDDSGVLPPAERKPTEGDLPESWNGALVYSDSATLTASDGRFRLVVPTSPIVLRVFGPTAEYRLFDYGYQRCPQCGKEHLRPGEHARVRIDPTAPNGKASAARDDVRITLRRGETIRGRAIGPNGKPIRDGVLICRTVSQPLRKPAPLLLPIHDGVFELPGCVPGRVYPVLMFDAARELAVAVEIQLRGTGDVGTVRLDHCGTAAVRLVDGADRPIAGRRPMVAFWLADDRPADLDGANGPWSTPVDMSWVDPIHYLASPVTDADGRIAAPGLVPGLQYHVTFTDRPPRAVYSQPFRVAPGQNLQLSDLVAPPDAADEGHAVRPTDSRAKGVEKLPKK